MSLHCVVVVIIFESEFATLFLCSIEEVTNSGDGDVEVNGAASVLLIAVVVVDCCLLVLAQFMTI